MRPKHDLYFLFVGINNNMFNAASLKLCPNYSKLFEGLGSVRTFRCSSSIQLFPTHSSTSTPVGRADRRKDRGDGHPRSREAVRKAGRGFPHGELIRVREDRTRDFEALNYFGNDFRVAELTWNNFLDPLVKANLWDGVGASYFQEEKATVYRPQVFYLSFIKTQRIRSIARSDWWWIWRAARVRTRTATSRTTSATRVRGQRQGRAGRARQAQVRHHQEHCGQAPALRQGRLPCAGRPPGHRHSSRHRRPKTGYRRGIQLRTQGRESTWWCAISRSTTS